MITELLTHNNNYEIKGAIKLLLEQLFKVMFSDG